MLSEFIRKNIYAGVIADGPEGINRCEKNDKKSGLKA